MPSKRVLVVDDDASIRRLVATVLKRESYDVDTANGGREALSKIALIQYDVVVLDLMMPDVNGLDVLKALALRHPKIKCVVLMSAASPFETAKSITANVFDAIAKPFDIQILITAVAGCIEAACDPAAPPLPKAA
ncbi:MAG TPA: response regulator [Thermoanaerobaculia bacterium]|jgi:DNA-binding NtrC family response regulator